MHERVQYIKAIAGAMKGEISSGIDSRLRSLNLFEYEQARRIVDLGTRGIEVEPIPPSLEEGKSAILVSNYPISVVETTRAVLKVGCRLPGEKPRFKAIGRKEVVTEAGLLLKVLGIDEIVFPVQKDESGVYRLESRRAYEEILSYLEEPGHVIWLSITGETRGNGLLEEDLRTGAVTFSLRRQVPIVPMGIVTKEKRRKAKVVRVRFGEPISLPDTKDLSDFETGDFLIDYSRLAMCQIARLLPAGQRGSFEDVEEKLGEIYTRLRTYSRA